MPCLRYALTPALVMEEHKKPCCKQCAEAEAPQQQTKGIGEDVVGGLDFLPQVLESRRQVEEAKEREAKGDVLDPGRSGRSW